MPCHPAELPKITGNYRKLPGFAIFPARRTALTDPKANSTTRQNYRNLPETTGFYRVSRFFRLAGLLSQTPTPTRPPGRTTGIYRKLPEITGFHDFSGSPDCSHRVQHQLDHPAELPKITGIYRVSRFFLCSPTPPRRGQRPCLNCGPFDFGIPPNETPILRIL